MKQYKWIIVSSVVVLITTASYFVWKNNKKKDIDKTDFQNATGPNIGNIPNNPFGGGPKNNNNPISAEPPTSFPPAKYIGNYQNKEVWVDSSKPPTYWIKANGWGAMPTNPLLGVKQK